LIQEILDDLGDIPLQDLLECLNEAIDYQKVQDHINFKQYQPNDKQKAFHATGLIAKERAFFAGNRCGKSMCTSAEWSMHLTGIYPDWWNGYRYDNPISIWVAGLTNTETYQTLKKYYVGEMGVEGFVHSTLIVKTEPQRHLYFIQHSSGGVSKLRFKSYEQGEEAWQAETLDGVHMDEEPPSKIYSEAITRVASTSPDHHGMITLSMTPLKGVTTIMLKYMQYVIFDDKGEEIGSKQVAPEELINSKVYVLASHDDATHLTEEVKNWLYNSYSPHEREARTKGIPSLGSGLIYPVHEAALLVQPFDIPEYWPRCFGMDFGWHNTAAVFMAHDQDNDVVYLYGEYLAGHLTPQHHAFQLIRQGADWMPGAYDHAGESAGQDYGGNVVDLYQQAGIRNWSPADKRSVNKGIYTVLQRMETGKLKIFTSLTKLMTEMRMYSRDENGKIKKGNDHLMDAMRYGVVTGIPLARVKNSVTNKLRIPTSSSGGSWMRV
jgi:phage terminase large subunit-like protein